MLPEDVNPSDNVCFAVVSVSSGYVKNMSRIFRPRYFQAGMAVQCGEWLSKSQLDDAILDAKKSERVGWTIASVVGGAAGGVGLTELIGRQIDGFEGQKDLKNMDLLRSQVLALQKSSPRDYDDYMRALRDLNSKCNRLPPPATRPEKCAEVESVLAFLDGKKETKGDAK
jgi:hypothetical protein